MQIFDRSSNFETSHSEVGLRPVCAPSLYFILVPAGHSGFMVAGGSQLHLARLPITSLSSKHLHSCRIFPLFVMFTCNTLLIFSSEEHPLATRNKFSAVFLECLFSHLRRGEYFGGRLSRYSTSLRCFTVDNFGTDLGDAGAAAEAATAAAAAAFRGIFFIRGALHYATIGFTERAVANSVK